MHRGIIQSLNDISPDEKFKYFSIYGKTSENSSQADVLFTLNDTWWYQFSDPSIAEPYVEINISEGYGIYVSHVQMRSGDANFPYNWKVEAKYYNKTFEIDSHSQDPIFNSTSFTSNYFPVEQGYYTSFKFIMNGNNLNNEFTFCLSYIDFFGVLTNEEGKPIIIAPYFKYCDCTFNQNIFIRYSLTFVAIMLYSYS